MKLAFVDASSNKADIFAACAEHCSQNLADVELARFTAPDLTKLPVACKKAFNEGCDAAVVFATARGDDEKWLEIISQKILDVETDAVKYAFVVIVFEDEHRTTEQLGQESAAKVMEAIEAANNFARGAGGSAQQPQEEIPMPTLGLPEPEGEAVEEKSVHDLF